MLELHLLLHPFEVFLFAGDMNNGDGAFLALELLQGRQGDSAQGAGVLPRRQRYEPLTEIMVELVRSVEGMTLGGHAR